MNVVLHEYFYPNMRKHHQFLLLTSQTHIISAAYCLLYSPTLSYLTILPAGVYFNSLNYWRQPLPGWRRNVDIIWGCSSLTYQIYVACCMQVSYWYFVFCFMSVICYPFEYIVQSQKQYTAVTILHGFLHIFGNIANLILYSY